MRNYLGTGLKYPYKVNTYGRVELATENELIQQSILRILQTPVGSTYMNRDFGSHLRELVHEPNDTVLFNLLDYFIREAIETWEKRVSFISTEFEQPEENPGLINCIPTYLIRQSNQIDSFIYPFYRELKF
jgi:phage baseplate assembly protein W